MSRYVLPLILIIAAVGLFVAYTNPQYQGPGGIKSVKAEVAQYDDALNKSQELKMLRDQLLSRYNTFSAEDKDKLQRVLPDNVDNIRLVIDINNIAARHALSVRNLELNSDKRSAKESNAAAAALGSGNAVGSVDFGFTVSANYDTFLAFLADLEHSLRLVDVKSISFRVSDTGIYDVALSIRTYWLH
jgi:hypothetical protein